ncbi:hypothetical protein, partial [Salinicoccus roseus]|uniref:hypothetical protein n=1 Tax=Salinicoccus roseus TaxID=45670 RepID=UPI003567A62E
VVGVGVGWVGRVVVGVCVCGVLVGVVVVGVVVGVAAVRLFLVGVDVGVPLPRDMFVPLGFLGVVHHPFVD